MKRGRFVTKFGMYNNETKLIEPTTVLNDTDMLLEIKNVVDSLSQYNEQLNRRVKVFWDNYSVPIHFYNHVMLNCIQKDYGKYSGTSLIELLCKLNDVNVTCTKVVRSGTYQNDEQHNELLEKFKLEDGFRSGLSIKENGKYTVLFQEFVHDLIDTCNKTDCDFTCIDFGVFIRDDKGEQFGHANAILAIKDAATGKIMLFVYDPHGTFKETSVFASSTTNFLLSIMEVAPNMFVLGKREKVSSYHGFQAVIRHEPDEIGLCHFLSLFWLHLYMKISTKKRITLDNMYKIEKLIIDNYSPPQIITILQSFVMILINAYSVETEQQLNTPLLVRDLKLDMTTEFSDKYRYYRQEIDPKELGDRKHIEDSEIYQVTESVEDDLSPKKIDKEYCDHHSECLSNLCRKNLCISADDYFNNQEKFEQMNEYERNREYNDYFEKVKKVKKPKKTKTSFEDNDLEILSIF
jgi:hypothetical protein